MLFNIVGYKFDLLVYIIMISIIALVVFLMVNMFFLILKIRKKFNEKKIWISINILLLVLFIFLIGSPGVDLLDSSFCEIRNVKKIEQSSDTSTHIDRFAGSIVFITDENGKVYTCYDYIFENDKLKIIEYPCTVVYAKHSKLLLDCY